jgi:hypothetical protein
MIKVIFHTAMLSFVLNACTSSAQVMNKSKFQAIIDFALKEGDALKIDDHYDLGGQIYQVRNLDFVISNKGSLSNGVLVGNGSKITASSSLTLKNVKLKGNWTGKAFIDWLVPNIKLSPSQNFNAMCSLIESGFTIHLDKLYSIAASNSTASFSTSRAIKIIGSSNKAAGLVLQTKHKMFSNYFQNNTGNSLFLYNILLTTKDYIDGGRTNAECDYFFTGSCFQSQLNVNAKPMIDSIVVANCKINGSICIAGYSASSKNQDLQEFNLKNNVRYVAVENNEFNYCNAPFAFSNLGYDSIIIKNNVVHNMSCSFISLPSSGLDLSYYPALDAKKGDVLFEKNKFKNDVLIDVPKGRAMTTCVIKGGKSGNLTFRNNTVLNLLSKSEDADVYPFYFTGGGKGIFEDNEIKNVCGLSRLETNCLVKQRGIKSLVLKRNTFILEKDALCKLGIIEDKFQSLSELNVKYFAVTWMNCGNSFGFNKDYVIEDNLFKTPLINGSTLIQDVASLQMRNNKFEIGYFGTSNLPKSISSEGVMLLAYQRYDRDKGTPARDFISENNDITIEKSAVKNLKWIYYTFGVQNGSGGNPDTEFNYNLVKFDDNFIINNTTIIYQILDGINQEYSSRIKGNNSSFKLFENTDGNTLRPSASNIKSNFITSSHSYSNLYSPFILIAGSNQNIEVKEHNGEDINLMHYIYFNSLYNLKSIEGMLITFDISYEDNLGSHTLKKKIYLENKTRLFTFYSDGKLSTVNPGANRSITTRMSDESEKVKGPHIKLIDGDNHKTRSKIILSGTSLIESFKVHCTVTPENVTSVGQNNFQILR